MTSLKKSMIYKSYYRYFHYFFISQLLLLGAFWIVWAGEFVIESKTKLCGEFTKGNAIKANWLPLWWKSIYTDNEIEASFAADPNCSPETVQQCCRSQWYRYAWVPIWVASVSKERKWAEFLAYKWYINSQSLSPDNYKLEANISRKEIMKVIMNMSGKEVSPTCREIYDDVDADWGCKYIESALEHEFIVSDRAFRPNDSITRVEALKLIFKAQNISKSYDTWYWEEDYISTAYYHWYIDQKFSDYNSIATRGWIFSAAAKTHSDNWK